MVDDIKTDEVKKEEPTSTDSGNGNQQGEASLLTAADMYAKRLEEANKRGEEILKRQEELYTRIVLGGRTTAGKPQKTAEEIAKEEEDKIINDAMIRWTGRPLKQ